MSYTEAFQEIGALIAKTVNNEKIVEKIEMKGQKFLVKFSDSERLYPFKYTAHGVIKFLEIYETVEEKLKNGE